MNINKELADSLSFGFEQTFTIENWWEDPGFTATSDTPLKREKMLALAESYAKVLNGTFKESLDIWNHLQYEVFDEKQTPSFVVTMDPGSIEVKTPPVLFKDILSMAEALFEGAKQASVVPYRNWWFGVKGGTEGGCHINMGGLTSKTNPFKKEPLLLVKYAAYLHNRPFLHYPFMSLDVGPGGNAQRMDEKDDFKKLQMLFFEIDQRQDEKWTIDKVYQFFKETSLIKEKASFPSFAKYNKKLEMIEDRAQESFQAAHELVLMCEMRLKILSYLQTTTRIEALQDFDLNLHKDHLSSYNLWSEFQYWANTLEINPVPYQVFFERQFPKLISKENYGLKIGRRPRVITDIKKRGDTIISKTIDPRFKRFEVYAYSEDEKIPKVSVSANGIEYESELIKNHGFLGLGNMGVAYYKIIDVCVDKDQAILEININGNTFKYDMENMI